MNCKLTIKDQRNTQRPLVPAAEIDLIFSFSLGTEWHIWEVKSLMSLRWTILKLEWHCTVFPSFPVFTWLKAHLSLFMRMFMLLFFNSIPANGVECAPKSSPYDMCVIFQVIWCFVWGTDPNLSCFPLKLFHCVAVLKSHSLYSDLALWKTCKKPMLCWSGLNECLLFTQNAFVWKVFAYMTNHITELWSDVLS